MAIEHLQDEQLIHLQKFMFEKDMDQIKKGAEKAGIPLNEFVNQLSEMHMALKQGRHEYFIEDPNQRKIPPRSIPPRSSGVFQRLKTALGMNASTN